MLHLVPPPKRSPEAALMAQRHVAPSPGYANLFGAASTRLPGARHTRIREWREANFERFRALGGFPGPKVEAWKYTPLGHLARHDYRLAPKASLQPADVAPFLLDRSAATRLVFVDGHFAAELSDDLSALPSRPVRSLAAALDDGSTTLSDLSDILSDADADRSLSALNAAFAGDGCLLQIDDGAALPRPVQLLFVSLGHDEPMMTSPRNVVLLGAGARLELIESHVALGGGQRLTNLVNRFAVGRGAELVHERLQLGDVAGSLIGKNHYRISADAG